MHGKVDCECRDVLLRHELYSFGRLEPSKGTRQLCLYPLYQHSANSQVLLLFLLVLLFEVSCLRQAISTFHSIYFHSGVRLTQSLVRIFWKCFHDINQYDSLWHGNFQKIAENGKSKLKQRARYFSIYIRVESIIKKGIKIMLFEGKVFNSQYISWI